MVSSLLEAKDWIGNSPFIVTYSDIFYEINALEELLKSEEDVRILYDLNWQKLWENRFSNPLEDAETFKVDNESFLLEIGNKTNNLENIEGQYMGLLYFSTIGWERILKTIETLDLNQIKKIDMTSLLKIIISLKVIKIKAIPYQGVWGEVDNKEDLEFYNMHYNFFK